MARARNIKPSIMDNEDLAELEPLARLLFIFLWMLADREGRLEDRPKRIAAQALPYDRKADVEKMLTDLQRGGFIVRYSAAGVACIQIPAFVKHQSPHGTEKDSSLPDKDGMFTRYQRGKNGYATGQGELVNSVLTVKKLSDNALNYECGIMNHDSSVTKVTAAPPPDSLPSEKSKTELWKSAVSLLGGQGVPEAQARSLIGKLTKDYKSSGDDIVFKAVEGAVLEQPADARAYLKATCQRLAGERKRDGSKDWTAEAI